MGVMIRWNKPEEGSSWDQVNIYKGSAEGGPFTSLKELGIDFTEYFDEEGTSSNWYTVAFFNTDTSYESEQSDPIQGGTYPYYATPTDLFHFVQLNTINETDRPTVGEVLSWISLAHVELLQDTDTGDLNFLKLLTLNLSAAYVMRALAHQALVRGYISFSVEGVSITKPYAELQEESNKFRSRYDNLIRKFETDSVWTANLSRQMDSTALRDLKDIYTGESDGIDYERNTRLGYSRRRPVV